MSRMVYGNLAVKPEQYPLEQKRKPVQQQKPVQNKTLKPGLQVREKLTYLLLVVVFVAVSGILISRYALVAELNYKAIAVKNQISDAQKDMELLQLKISELSSPDRILKKAEEMGLTQHDGNVKTLKTVTTASLSKEKDTGN